MVDQPTAQAVWSTFDWFQIIGLGAVAGGIGQGIRTIVGLKKLGDTASGTTSSVADLIQPSRLIVSMLIGAVAGALAATTIIKDVLHVSAEQFFGLAAAGYAGADFIEGFVNRVSPPTGSGGSGAAPKNNQASNDAVG